MSVAKVVEGEVRSDPLITVSKIDGEGFFVALKSALEKSRMFEIIAPDHDADYELQTRIISQEVKPGFTATSTLFVNYRLVAKETRNEVWEQNILSQDEVTFTVFDGGKRQRMANEAAVRDNLRQLLQELSTLIETKLH